MKDPAFLFYPESFLLGTLIMPFEERGKYITLLCYQHQNGHLSEETIRLLVGTFSDLLKSKFLVDENGLYYNNRLEIEIEKRTAFVDSRRENGKNGGRPKKPNGKPSGKPNGKPKNNLPINRDIIRNIIKEQKLNANYEQLWVNWKQYKKDQHNFNYKSEQSETIAINELLKLSGNSYEIAVDIIERSIGKGWAGLFAPENKTPQQKERVFISGVEVVGYKEDGKPIYRHPG
jgi:hypothetical protein